MRLTDFVESFQAVDGNSSSHRESWLSDEERSIVGSTYSSDCEYVPIDPLNGPLEWSLDANQDYLYPGQTPQRSFAISDDNMELECSLDEDFLPEEQPQARSHCEIQDSYSEQTSRQISIESSDDTQSEISVNPSDSRQLADDYLELTYPDDLSYPDNPLKVRWLRSLQSLAVLHESGQTVTENLPFRHLPSPLSSTSTTLGPKENICDTPQEQEFIQTSSKNSVFFLEFSN